MLKSKKEVDRHVSDISRKLQNDDERKLRGLSFARLYLQVKEYDTALRFVTSFLSVRESNPEAHKLLGQIAEANGNLERAIQSYKRSLELDSSQKEVVLRICKLYCQLSVDSDTARYWADRGEKLFPNHEVVFQLRECLVNADGEPNLPELEQLITRELKSRPLDTSLHIKLLKLYMDTERIQEAYCYAVDIEEKRPFPFSINWYFCLADICEAYQEECEQQITVDFYIFYLAALDHLVSLVLAEPHALLPLINESASHRSRNIVDSASILHTFDQQLKRCTQSKFSQDGAWFFVLNHMKGQLYLHLATLLLKRAKKDQGNWKEACRHASALLLVAYSFKPGNPQQELWFSAGECKQSSILYFQKAGAARLSCTGHIIITLCKEDKTKWLQRIKQETCLSQVRDKIYHRAFNAVGQKQSAPKSYFLQDGTFLECTLEFPSQGSLQEYDKVYYKLHPNCLHHLVWLSLHRGSEKLVQTCHNFQLFEGLQYSSAVLTSGAPESLSQLDIEVFLCATTYTANLAMEQRRLLIHRTSGDGVLCVPPDIADPLCTDAQSSWWQAAYSLYTNTARLKLSEMRQVLRKGLEVIRGVGNHGMDVNLVVYLARAFADQALIISKAKGEEAAFPLEERAAHYWSLALSLLDGLMSNRRPQVSKDRLFVSYSREPSTREVASLREEGRFYLATRDMNQGQFENAARVFETLNSAYASYYFSSCLKKLAQEQQGEANSHEDCIALLTKARDALFLTMDRISGDKKHPLNAKLQLEIEELEIKLSKFQTDAFDSGEENEDTFSQRLMNGNLSDRSREGSANLHTSTPLNASSAYRHFRPSPERLDAQIRSLTYTQESFVRVVTDQQQVLLEKIKDIAEELKKTNSIVEDMKKQLEEFQKNFTHIVKQPKSTRQQKKSVQEENNAEEEEPFEEEQFQTQDRKEVPRSHPPRRGKNQYPDETDADYPEEFEGYPSEAPSSYPTRRTRRGAMKGQDYEDGYEGNDYNDPYYDYSLEGEPAIYSYMNGYTHGGLIPGMGYLHQPPPVMLQYPHHYPPPSPMAPLRPRGCYQQMDRGLPFSDGQQLPQFNFRMLHPQPSTNNIAPPPPSEINRPSIFSRLGPETPAFAGSPVAQISTRMPAGPWPPSKVDAGVAHAFQIPLPTSVTGIISSPPGILSVPIVSSGGTVVSVTPTSSGGELKTILNTSSISIGTVKKGPLTGDAVVPPSLAHNAETSKKTSTRRLSSSRDETHSDPEEEAHVDFKPAIPLPAEIAVHTGEESETILFENRAKLFRFMEKEWRERGIGIIKLLVNDSGKVRVLMRRDQVLKICANHYVSGSMELMPMKDRGFIWAAQDFADEEIKLEKFCIRFKTVEIAEEFRAAFEKSMENARKLESQHFEISTPEKLDSTTSQVAPAYVSIFSGVDVQSLNESPEKSFLGEEKFPGSFGGKFRPKPGSWTCSACFVNNEETQSACVACTTPKLGTLQGTVKPSLISGGGGFKLDGSNFFSDKSSVATPASDFLSQLASKQQDNSKVVGGFSFTSTPVFQEVKENSKSSKPPEQKKVDPKTSPFANLNFPKVSVTSTTASTACPIFGSTSDASLLSFGSFTEASNKEFQKSEDFKGFPQAGSNVFSEARDNANQSRNSTDDFEPNVEFAPVIPLPEIVETQTGEENEEKVFGERAKLYRFDVDSKEWKERGVGELKILRHKRTSRYRILMRREQVHKLCANHYIVPQMKLIPMSTSDKTWTWMAQDFSDTELKNEYLAARFKNVDVAQQFKLIFEKCLANCEQLVSDQISATDTDAEALDSSTSDKLFEMKAVLEVKLESGSWECSTCYVRNSVDRNVCIACNASKPVLAEPAKEPAVLTPFKFGISETPKTDSATKSSALAEFKFGTPTTASTTANAAKFVFGSPSQLDNSASSLVNFGCMAQPTVPLSKNSNQSPFSFVTAKTTDSAATPSVFGSFQFGSPQKDSGQSSGFRFGSPQKYEFNFSGVRPRSPTKSLKSPGTPSDVSRELTDEEPEPSDADNIFFQPVIPLPPKVDVKTGEEDEELLYCQRSKVYRFDQGEWKERGIGDLKILHNAKSGSVRLLMRREQVLKVCINHYLTKEMHFLPKGEKSWMWAATDYSDNEPHPEQLALRFSKPETAQKFKTAIEDAKKLLHSDSSVATTLLPTLPSTLGSVALTNAEKTPSLSFLSSPGSNITDADSSDVSKSPADLFSFRSATKQSSSSGGFSLSSRFGTSVGRKSLFGNSSPSAESVSGGIEIVYEKKPTPEQVEKALKLQLPPTFYLYEDKEPCPGCIGCRDEAPSAGLAKLEDGFPILSESIKSSTGHSSLDGKEARDKPAEMMFGSKPMPSFAELAADAPSSTIPFKAESSKTTFQGAGTLLFASAATSSKDDATADDDQEVTSPDVHFEPLLPLPELVDVMTGEEEEEPIYCQRVKLYRFDSVTHQWKERGIGNLKILQHKDKCQFRLLLRREQVHKVACNHYISKNTTLSPLNSSEVTVFWSAVDFSDGSLNTDLFAARFKSKELADEFKVKIEECKRQLQDAEETSVPENTAQNVEEETKKDDNETEEDEENDDDNDEEVMLEKRVELSVSNIGLSTDYKSVGLGTLKVLYDDTVFGARIKVNGDDGTLLADSLIAVQTCLRTQDKQAFWTAVDMSADTSVRRHFRATFASLNAVIEFKEIFDEGKQYAINSEIVEEQDHLPSQ